MTKTAKKPGKPKEKRKYVRKPKVYPPEALELPPGGELGLSEDELLAELCRESFFEFVKAFWPTIIAEKPVWNWHIEFLCGELQEVAERVFAGLPRKHDLVVNVSPGTTKSTLISVMLPAWIWTRMPSARIISATYAYTLATDFSRKSKDVITSELYRRLFPDVKIRDDQKAKNNYVNTHGGERFATGVAGVILGKHAHFIIVDDPITPTQSCSDLELANANRWMEETLPSRMVDKALTPTILVMQRLHENDPTGSRLEKADRSPVRHVCLPAELTEDVKPEGCRARYVDGLFDPVRLSHETLSGIEARQGEFVLCSQYLQKPIPRGTAMFLTDKIRVEQPPLKFRRLVRAWDKAATSQGGAFTVGTKMGEDFNGRLWVLNVIRVQVDTGRREALILATARADGKKVRIGIEEEPGSGGKHSALVTVKNLAGFSVVTFKVGRSDGDKETRAYALSSQVNVGNVSMAPADWNKAFVHELRFFPRSKYKDQVDSSSLAANMLSGKRVKIGALSKS